jgi:hypothetical protein
MTRLRITLAVLFIGAAGVSGCGGSKPTDRSAPAAPPVAPSTQAAAPVAPTIQAARTTQAARPHARAQRAAKPRARTTPAATPATPTTKTATPGPVAKKPAAKRKPSKRAPLACLAQAKLRKPAKSGDGLWRAQEPKSGKPVFVDGPYQTAGEAKSSAASLVGVQDAAKGGLYVVSAALTSKAGPVVRNVAKCLEARG